ncbi:phosphatase PAP2 family protein [Streptomyces jumonjinensis]|uniref:phosphatase PAP2 family protein n=1 Tax=Streptomyces jumonjinensis TaxID=1945 RepID=UPI0037B9D43F
MGYADCAAADERVLAVMRACGDRPAVAATARALSYAGEHAALWLATGLLAASADPGRRAAWLRATAVVGGAHLASVGVKWAVRRPRPGGGGRPGAFGRPGSLGRPGAPSADGLPSAGGPGSGTLPPGAGARGSAVAYAGGPSRARRPGPENGDAPGGPGAEPVSGYGSGRPGSEPASVSAYGSGRPGSEAASVSAYGSGRPESEPGLVPGYGPGHPGTVPGLAFALGHPESEPAPAPAPSPAPVPAYRPRHPHAPGGGSPAGTGPAVAAGHPGPGPGPRTSRVRDVPQALVRTAGPYSFPSSHAASASAAAVAFGALLPAGRRVLAPLAAAMCLSRLVVGVHYPTDVAAGAVLGGIAARIGVRGLTGPLHPGRRAR